MASNALAGREAVLYFSTSTGSTNEGDELAYASAWSVDQSRNLIEVTKINSNSVEYVEGLISGTVSVSGIARIGDTISHKLFNRFMKLELDDTSDTSRDAIADGNLYFHGIVRAIDTDKTSDDMRGAKVYGPALSNSFTYDVTADGLITWDWGGTFNGDAIYVESSSTGRGIPKVS